jgi:hypothetical protein
MVDVVEAAGLEVGSHLTQTWTRDSVKLAEIF